MPEWLYEEGIGENRAALVEAGEIIAAEIERDDPWPRVGTVRRARYDAPLVGRQQAMVKLEGGGEAMLGPVPERIGPGSRFTVEVMREFFMSPVGPSKSMRVRIVPDDTPLREGPTLLERIAAQGVRVRRLRSFEPDLLEQAGWSELLEEAETGIVKFPGGSLDIHLTPAMTLIDVNGVLELPFLAVDGARAAARAINRLRLSGSIGIDLPTVAGREPRKRAAEAVDETIHGKFERSAVNGFGFLQVVKRQERASLMHLMQAERGRAVALALLRRAERDPHVGPIELVAHVDVQGSYGAPRYIEELARRRGAPAYWRWEPALPISGAHVRPISTVDEDDDDES